MGAVTDPSLLLILRVLATIVTALGLVAMCTWFVFRLPRMLSLVHQRYHELRLTNQGNVSSFYHLVIESQHQPLQFQLARNKIPLDAFTPQEQEEQELAEEDEPELPVEAAAENAQAKGTKSTATHSGKAINVSKSVQAASKPVKSAAGLSGALGGMLGMLGSLLPGAIGKGLREQGAALRNVQTQSTRAMQAPETGLRKIDDLKKQSGKLSGSLPSSEAGAKAGKSITEQPAVVQAKPARQRARMARKKQTPKKKKSAPGFYSVKTPALAPGETILLSLYVRWKKLHAPASSLYYTVRSQQIPVGFDRRDAIDPVSNQGGVFFGSVEAWRYWLYYFASTLAIFVGIFLFLVAYSLIWLS